MARLHCPTCKLHCPTCKHSKTRVLRTRPDDDFAATDRTHVCKNPSCNAIFAIHETLLSILQSGADVDPVREILGAVCNLPTEMQVEVKRALDAV